MFVGLVNFIYDLHLALETYKTLSTNFKNLGSGISSPYGNKSRVGEKAKRMRHLFERTEV